MPSMPTASGGEDFEWTDCTGLYTGRPNTAKVRKRRQTTPSTQSRSTANRGRRSSRSSTTSRPISIRPADNLAPPPPPRPEEHQLSDLSRGPFGLGEASSTPIQSAYSYHPHVPDPGQASSGVNFDPLGVGAEFDFWDGTPSSTQQLPLLPGEAEPGSEPPPPDSLPRPSGVLAKEPEGVGHQGVRFKAKSGALLQGRGVMDARREDSWVSKGFAEKLGIGLPPNAFLADSGPSVKVILRGDCKDESISREKSFNFKISKIKINDVEFCLGWNVILQLNLITIPSTLIPNGVGGYTGGQYSSATSGFLPSQMGYGLQSPTGTNNSAVSSQHRPNTKDPWLHHYSPAVTASSSYGNGLGGASATLMNQALEAGADSFAGSFQAQLAQATEPDVYNEYHNESGSLHQGDPHAFPPHPVNSRAASYVTTPQLSPFDQGGSTFDLYGLS